MSFKYIRLPNICYWCGCLNHVDRDCDLWIKSDGKLIKENQSYVAWIRAPYSKGRNFIVNVPGFYESRKKATQLTTQNGGKEIVLAVVLGSKLPSTVVQIQNKATANLEGEINGESIQTGLVRVSSNYMGTRARDTWDDFEIRLGEIDCELNKFESYVRAKSKEDTSLDHLKKIPSLFR